MLKESKQQIPDEIKLFESSFKPLIFMEEALVVESKTSKKLAISKPKRYEVRSAH